MFGSPLKVSLSPIQPNPEYIALGARFDGNDSVGISEVDVIAAGVVDGKLGTFSCWFKRFSTGFQFLWGVAIDDVEVRFMSGGDGNVFRVFLDQGAEPDLRSLTAMTDLTTWHHIICSWNRSTQTYHMYFDGADDLNVVASGSDNNSNYTAITKLGKIATGGSFFLNAELVDVYMNYDAAIDLSVEANRLKFRNSRGKPVFLGSQGELPTAAQPTFFFSGEGSALGVNKGYGGVFSAGTMTPATSSPS